MAEVPRILSALDASRLPFTWPPFGNRRSSDGVAKCCSSQAIVFQNVSAFEFSGRRKQLEMRDVSVVFGHQDVAQGRNQTHR